MPSPEQVRAAVDAVDIVRVNDDAKITSVAAYWDMAAARPPG
jgi:hypothetical protein